MNTILKKGGELNFSQHYSTLKKVMIGLGWSFEGNKSFDLDASIFMLGPTRKLVAEEYFIFYNNRESPDGAVKHTGDSRSGKGQDDETILVDFELINPAISEIVILVSIHDAHLNKLTFSSLNHTYIRIQDLETDCEILRYELDKDFDADSATEFGRIVRVNSEWFFKATGIGMKSGLQGFIDMYA